VLTNGSGEYTASFFRVITSSENKAGLFPQNAGKLVPDCTVSVRTITVCLQPHNQGCTNPERPVSRLYKFCTVAPDFFSFLAYVIKRVSCPMYQAENVILIAHTLFVRYTAYNFNLHNDFYILTCFCVHPASNMGSHSTQYTVRSTQYAVRSTQYAVHSTQYTVHSTQYTVRSTQYTVHSIQYTVRSTHYAVRSTQYAVRSTQFTVQSTRWLYLWPMHVGLKTVLRNTATCCHSKVPVSYSLQYISVVKPKWCTFYSIYYELGAWKGVKLQS
jgi:hypothetical protein